MFPCIVDILWTDIQFCLNSCRVETIFTFYLMFFWLQQKMVKTEIYKGHNILNIFRNNYNFSVRMKSCQISFMKWRGRLVHRSVIWFVFNLIYALPDYQNACNISDLHLWLLHDFFIQDIDSKLLSSLENHLLNRSQIYPHTIGQFHLFFLRASFWNSWFSCHRGSHSTALARWTAVTSSNERSCTRGMIHTKIHLFSLGSPVQYSLTVQNSGLKHQTFIFIHSFIPPFTWPSLVDPDSLSSDYQSFPFVIPNT